MKEDKQKIAIAEACGWTVNVAGKTVYSPSGVFNRTLFAEVSMILPDYPNDLNAMHEAVMTLSNRQLDDLHTWISDTMTGTDKYMWLLTPQQYAEAFLRTIGKWDDVE
jgi:hypothetical protein